MSDDAKRDCSTCRHWVRFGRVVGACREQPGSGELFVDESPNCMFWEPKDESER